MTDSRYTPLSLAVDVARIYNAQLILADVKFLRKEERSSIAYVPSYSTSKTEGAIENRYGTRKEYDFTAKTKTTTWNPLLVKNSYDIYRRNAIFYRRMDTEGMYGVFLDMPKRLPGEDRNSHVTVKISAVLRGSRAEEDGLRRGQRVLAVNGKKIRSRKDVMPFLGEGTRKIASVEVDNE